jgi:hypothetical protein
LASRQARVNSRMRRGASGAVAAVLILVLVIVGAGAYAYNEGYLPIGPSQNTSPSGPSNDQVTPTTTTDHIGGYSATPVDNIYNAYFSNAASAGLQYGGKTILVDGEIGNVEQDQNGNYESCVMAPSVSVLVTGCQIASIEGGFVIWTWASQQAAAKVPLDTLIVAQCTVAGLQNSNLVLTGCTLYDVPSQDIQQQQQAFCNTLVGGITISNLRVYAPSGGTRYGHNNNVNISMVVQNSGSQPVATLGGTALIYSNLPPVQVGALTYVVVNASSQAMLNFVIAQGVSATAILVGTTLHFTFDFGAGQQNGAGEMSVSGSCPIAITATASAAPASVTTTTTTLVSSLELGGVQLASFDFNLTNSAKSFTCFNGEVSTPPWYSMMEVGLNYLLPQGYPNVNITSVTITSGGSAYSYSPTGACGIQPDNQVLGVWLLFSHQYFPVNVEKSEQFQVTVNLSNGSQLQASGSFYA